MRGEKRRSDGSYPNNVLAGLPYYSLHLTRTVITNTLEWISSVPKSGISAMLAHAGDKAHAPRASTTTRTRVWPRRPTPYPPGVTLC